MNERQFFRADELSEQVQAGDQIRQPSEVPRFDGTGAGHMQGQINRGSEAHVQSGTGNQGNKGTEVYGSSELPGTNDPQGTGEYGSATVVSLSELAPAEAELDPGIAQQAHRPRTAQQIMAELRQHRQ